MKKHKAPTKIKAPSLPQLLKSKTYKTGQTRGASDDEIYQNRVGRNSTVIIPYPLFDLCKKAPTNGGIYENGFIVIIKPERYFNNIDLKKDLSDKGLEIGKNTLLFYETRTEWNKYNPEHKGLRPAISRTYPLGGEYIARIPATTSKEQPKILKGFINTSLKGARIRIYEYADRSTIDTCVEQLEYIYWQCIDAVSTAIQIGMSAEQVKARIASNKQFVEANKLNDNDALIKSRILNSKGNTICPLCLEPLSAIGFYSRLEQAEGREVPDLTITQIKLFHIRELRKGEFNHRPYNLGWGHHHCNVVVKDSGIKETVNWMTDVVKRNQEYDAYQAKIGI